MITGDKKAYLKAKEKYLREEKKEDKQRVQDFKNFFRKGEHPVGRGSAKKSYNTGLAKSYNIKQPNIFKK